MSRCGGSCSCNGKCKVCKCSLHMLHFSEVLGTPVVTFTGRVVYAMIEAPRLNEDGERMYLTEAYTTSPFTGETQMVYFTQGNEYFSLNDGNRFITNIINGTHIKVLGFLNRG